MLPQDVSSSGRPVVQAWDPYDVWLKRVKLPRERQPQRVPAAAAAANDARSADPSGDPLLLPGVS